MKLSTEQIIIKNRLNQRGAVVSFSDVGIGFDFKMWGTSESGSAVLRTKSRHETFSSAVDAAENHLAKIGS